MSVLKAQLTDQGYLLMGFSGFNLPVFTSLVYLWLIEGLYVFICRCVLWIVYLI